MWLSSWGVACLRRGLSRREGVRRVRRASGAPGGRACAENPAPDGHPCACCIRYSRKPGCGRNCGLVPQTSILRLGLPSLAGRMRNPFNPQYLISHLTNSNGCGNLYTKVLLTVSPFRPSLLPLLRVCFRNRRLVPSSAPRNVNISTILSTLRILPVATGVYPNPFRLPIPEPSPIPFRINICKSVSKQTTSTPFRIIHLCKTRRGEGLLLTSHVQFSVLPSQFHLYFCLPRPGRGGKSHVLSSLPPLGRSLRSFSHSLPLFSIACGLFSQNAGGLIP